MSKLSMKAIQMRNRFIRFWTIMTEEQKINFKNECEILRNALKDVDDTDSLKVLNSFLK